MNERFTLDSTLTDITENERVNRKLPFFFDMQLCEQIKWPFNKMKLKHMMKLMHFPGQDLLAAANFILERREAGEKISIPIWRDLPESEAVSAQNVIMVPFPGAVGIAPVPAVLICPGSENHRLKMISDGMEAAAEIAQKGCRAFILNYRPEYAGADTVRAIRFLRANCRKLGIMPEKVAVLAFQDAADRVQGIFRQGELPEDRTHRYDEIKGEPDQLWITSVLGSQWLDEMIRGLKAPEV